MLPHMLPTITCQQNAAKYVGFLVPFWVLLALNSVCHGGVYYLGNSKKVQFGDVGSRTTDFLEEILKINGF